MNAAATREAFSLNGSDGFDDRRLLEFVDNITDLDDGR